MPILPPTNFDDWQKNGTRGGRAGSFAKRYFAPLVRLAQAVLRADEALAHDLASGFCLRELERATAPGGPPPVFESYDPARGARFRTYLAGAFRHYCRDARAKDRLRSQHGALDDLPDRAAEAEGELLGALEARERLNAFRARLVAALAGDPDAVRYVELKWPAEIAEPLLPDEALGARLDPPRTRKQVRTIKKRVAAALLRLLDQEARAQGIAADRLAIEATDFFHFAFELS